MPLKVTSWEGSSQLSPQRPGRGPEGAPRTKGYMGPTSPTNLRGRRLSPGPGRQARVPRLSEDSAGRGGPVTAGTPLLTGVLGR